MANDLRIKTIPAWFVAFMLRTNAIQRRLISTPPDVYYATKLTWTPQDSDDWDDFTRLPLHAL